MSLGFPFLSTAVGFGHGKEKSKGMFLESLLAGSLQNILRRTEVDQNPAVQGREFHSVAIVVFQKLWRLL